jgi:hypothetical protein
MAASPLAFWWLAPSTVYPLGLVLVAAVYVGFAVADGPAEGDRRREQRRFGFRSRSGGCCNGIGMASRRQPRRPRTQRSLAAPTSVCGQHPVVAAVLRSSPTGLPQPSSPSRSSSGWTSARWCAATSESAATAARAREPAATARGSMRDDTSALLEANAIAVIRATSLSSWTSLESAAAAGVDTATAEVSGRALTRSACS